MKTMRTLAILLLSWMMAACTQSQTVEQTAAPAEPALDLFDVAWADREYQNKAWLTDSYEPAVDLSKATEYRMRINIQDDFSDVSGEQHIRYTNNEAIELDAIYMRLFPNLSGGETEVRLVSVDGRRVDPELEAQKSSLRIPLDEPLAPGGTTVIKLEFVTSIPREMGGNYGLFGYFDGFLVLDTFYPMIPVFDEAGWQRQATPPNGDPTYNDVSFYLVQVRAPASLMLFSTGSEVGRIEEEDEQIVTIASGPARDFYLAAAEDLEVLEKQVGSTTVRSYAPARYREHSNLVLEVGATALEVFEQRFGTYPYREIDLIGTPMLALGIEYPGIMAMRLGLYDPAESIGGVPTSIYLEGTVAHEVAHQWFYNVVGNDQVEEPWLDEALAQYATYLYYVDTYGQAAASGYRGSWFDRWDRTERAEIPIGLPAYEYESVEYGSIVYGRGPIFIDELAEAMGAESFDKFLLVYVQQHAWGIASTGSFQALAEDTCDCDLNLLFESWITGKE